MYVLTAHPMDQTIRFINHKLTIKYDVHFVNSNLDKNMLTVHAS